MNRQSGLNVEAEKIVGGSPWNVQFEIVTRRTRRRYNLRSHPSPEELQTYSFSGHPDFVCYSKRRSRMSTFEGTRVVGETQSPTGTDALTKSVGQVGIYTTGHLLQSRKSRMVSVVVTKQAGGVVLVTSYKHSEVELLYQFVHSLEPLKLDTVDGLECFCSILIAALAWQGKL